MTRVGRGAQWLAILATIAYAMFVMFCLVGGRLGAVYDGVLRYLVPWLVGADIAVAMHWLVRRTEKGRDDTARRMEEAARHMETVVLLERLRLSTSPRTLGGSASQS
jgi:hypothetical protein